MSLYYPPIIEGKLPACVKGTDNRVVITVPYVLNKAVNSNEYDTIAIKIKTVTTGAIKVETSTATCKALNTTTRTLNASFVLSTIDSNKLTMGNYYKVQIAFEKGNDKSPWSTVGVMKYTNRPEILIEGLDPGLDNINPTLFAGLYRNNDPAEKLYSYNFTIYDSDNNIYETSGDMMYDGTGNSMIGTQLNCSMSWCPKKTLLEDKIYRVILSVKTINNYFGTSAEYNITAESTIDARLPAKLLATPDYDNGCITLRLIPKDEKNEQRFSGRFVISRYCKSKNMWNQMCRFDTLAAAATELGVIWTDYTIEHGEQYLYAIQAYNNKGLHSNKIYHIVENLDIYNNGNKYIESDEQGNPCYITADFEDIFLTDKDRQLKIRFNPKVSSYKPTILESKIDTLGSKYPFIFRNGNVNYKEFPISGLLSYLMDEKELFMQGVYPPEVNLERRNSINGVNIKTEERLNITDSGSKLTSDNFFRERQFKTAVLEWLTDGKPKLFRSPSEGNMIVRLMNTSLTPNETVGRMLHTFNSTAYEIADCTLENLEAYGLLTPSASPTISMKYAEELIGGQFSKPYNLYSVRIMNATPGTMYNIEFSNDAPEKVVPIVVGLTGTYYVDSDVYPVVSITQQGAGDINGIASVHYGYYDSSIPDRFSYISNITQRPEASQIIGYDKTENVIKAKLEDIRREVSSFYSIVIKPRPILEVKKIGNDYYRCITVNATKKYLGDKIAIWDETTIYKVGNILYSGNPLNNDIFTSDDLIYNSNLPKVQFKLNDRWVLDLVGHCAYDDEEEIVYGLGDPIRSSLESAEHFRRISNGCYVIKDVDNVTSMAFTKGVYVELAYKLKEIEYTVEEEKQTVKTAKETWLELIEASKVPPAEGDEIISNADIQEAYELYIEALEEALEDVDFEEDYYAI